MGVMDANNSIAELALSRERFLAFVRSRIADPEQAEEILQSSLTRAVEQFGTLEDRERLVPWFYAILRNAITDSYRRAARVREVELPPQLDVVEEPPEAERRLCECFSALLPAIKPEYADLIETIDLNNEDAAAASARLGITANNLKVRHHRARQALRRALEDTCRVCAEHHCLDCTCQSEDRERAVSSEV
jgi:RNA polymerase sigma factor (sigma-70 family)